jgi:pSer/pThr/pTyr-binding forkhead associated (FHA) protein
VQAAVKLLLVCQDTLAFPREIVVERFPIELGRGQTVGVRIDDRWLSRRHCCLDLSDDGGLIVRDLGSRHGTFVNGHQIVECRLAPGDELCIGLSHFLAEYEPDSAVTMAVHA